MAQPAATTPGAREKVLWPRRRPKWPRARKCKQRKNPRWSRRRPPRLPRKRSPRKRPASKQRRKPRLSSDPNPKPSAPKRPRARVSRAMSTTATRFTRAKMRSRDIWLLTQGYVVIRGRWGKCFPFSVSRYKHAPPPHARPPMRPNMYTHLYPRVHLHAAWVLFSCARRHFSSHSFMKYPRGSHFTRSFSFLRPSSRPLPPRAPPPPTSPRSAPF